MPLSAQLAQTLIARARACDDQNVPALRTVRREISRELRGQPAELVLDVAGRVAQLPALRWIAYELIRFHPGAFAALDDALVDAFAVGLDSWDSVDAFARTLSGPAWVNGLVSDAMI